MISKYFKKWARKVKKSFLDNFPWSIISFLIIPFFVWALFKIIVGFGWFAGVAYLFSCLWKLDKLLEKVWRTIIWAVGYLIGAIAFSEFFNKVLPQLNEGIGALFFGIIIILLIILAYWLKRR